MKLATETSGTRRVGACVGMLTTVIKTHKGIKAISVSCFINFLVVSSYKIDLLICVCMCLNLQLTYITAGDIGDIKDHDKAGEDGVTFEKFPSLKRCEPTAEEWDTVRDIHAVLRITKHGTTLAQRERWFSGAYKAVIKVVTMKYLTTDTIEVDDLGKVSKSPTTR